MKNKKSSSKILLITFLALLLSQALLPSFARHSSAATLARTFIRFDRMGTSQATTGTICAQPATSSANVKTWEVAFPTGYTVSGTAANWQTTNISTTNLNWPSGGTAWPNATSATASIASQTVTWTNSSVQTMNTGTLYCYNWTTTAALSIKSSATNDNTGTITTKDNGAATIDSGTYATASVSNDQISVTASVNPTFQMSFSGGNTDALGTLTTGAVASSATTTMTVNTNAKNGWMAWAKDANTGLTSSSASYTIASTGVGSASQALVAGTEGYNTGVAYSQTSGTCTAGTAVNGNFDKAGGSNKGGGLDTTLRTILTCGGTTNAGVITPTVFAAINGATAAANDYTDTQTYVAAGLF